MKFNELDVVIGERLIKLGAPVEIIVPLIRYCRKGLIVWCAHKSCMNVNGTANVEAMKTFAMVSGGELTYDNVRHRMYTTVPLRQKEVESFFEYNDVRNTLIKESIYLFSTDLTSMWDSIIPFTWNRAVRQVAVYLLYKGMIRRQEELPVDEIDVRYNVSRTLIYKIKKLVEDEERTLIKNTKV